MRRTSSRRSATGAHAPAKVVARTGDADDLAILDVPLKNQAAATFGSALRVEPGMAIGVLGYPIPDAFEDEHLGQTVSLYTGRVASVRKGALEIDVPIIPGESGGPVSTQAPATSSVSPNRASTKSARSVLPRRSIPRPASSPNTPASKPHLDADAGAVRSYAWVRMRERSPIQRAGGCATSGPSRRAMPRTSRGARETQPRRRRAGAAAFQRVQLFVRQNELVAFDAGFVSGRQAEIAREVAHEVPGKPRRQLRLPAVADVDRRQEQRRRVEQRASVPTHDSSSWLERKYVSTP